MIFWLKKASRNSIISPPYDGTEGESLLGLKVAPVTGVNILPLFVAPGIRNLLDPTLKTRNKLDPP